MTRFNPRIVIAFVFGLFIVAGSFWLSKEKPLGNDSIVAVKAEEDNVPLRGFIPVNDQDSDGLPDWQNTFDIATVYVDEKPEEDLTRTGALAAELATRIIAGNEDPSVISSDINADIDKEFIDKDYTVADIKTIQDNSREALKAYGNEVASIAFRHAPPRTTESELAVLNRALLRNDPEILAGLDPTITSYENMLADMLDTPVPESLTREHLALINVYQAILNDIKAFRGVFNDALPSIARFNRYTADVTALDAAIIMLYEKLYLNGILWSENDPAFQLIKIE